MKPDSCSGVPVGGEENRGGTSAAASHRKVALRSVVAAALLGIVMTTAGCGGGSPAPDVASVSAMPATTARAGTSLQQKVVAYASCIRAHGVSDFPDSAISIHDGHVDFHVPAAIKGEPRFRSASQACDHDLPSGSTSTKEVSIRSELAFARCMRSHGFPAFPDPLPGGGFDVRGDTSSSAFQSANQACAAKLHATGK